MKQARNYEIHRRIQSEKIYRNSKVIENMIMITKEEFLRKTTEDEVFSLIEEFLTRLKEMGEEYKQLVILDKTKGKICREIITDCKKSNYL